jgi:cytochrome P450
MAALTSAMLERWQSLSQVELYAEMKQLTQRIVVKTLLGLDDERVIDQIGTLFQQLTASMEWLFFTPSIDVPGMPYHRTLKLARQWESFLHALIAQKRKEAEATDVLAALVQAHDEDGTRLTDDELFSQTFFLYAAGHVTTSTALTWIIFLLHQHPRIHADLLAELDGTLHGEVPTFASLQHLPLLDGVIKESLRLLPPTPTSMRTTAAPCELGGFALPKGATIFYSPFLTHRFPELYEEPDRFQPQRWETLSRTPYEYLPFAAGPHRCIGAEFALLEIKVVVAMLLQQYRLAVVPNARIEPKGSDIAPAHGMPVRIIPQDRRFERVPVRGNIHRLVEFG